MACLGLGGLNVCSKKYFRSLSTRFMSSKLSASFATVKQIALSVGTFQNSDCFCDWLTDNFLELAVSSL